MDKRLIAIVASLTLLLQLPSAPASATSPTPGNCTSGSLTISSNVVTSALGCSGEAVVPATVTAIDPSAFEDEADIHTVTFASGSFLTSIGATAFANSGITSIDIPASVTTIGINAFWGTTTMTTIRFAAGSALTSIGNSAFTYSGITSIDIPASVTTLGTYVFERTDDLLTASFAAGSSLTSVPEGLFHYSNVGSVTLPGSLTSIGASAFYNNTNLSSITIPSGVTSIGANAFGSSPTLTTIRFEGLTAPAVGANAFSSLPAGATASIKYNATGFDTVGGFWNSLTVTRDAAPAPASTPLPVIPPVQTPAPPVSISFSLDSPSLATPQKKALRELIAEVGKEGSFEVVARVVRTPGMSKAQARALALAKAKEIKRYLVSKGVKRKDIVISSKIVKPGKKAKTEVIGSKD